VSLRVPAGFRRKHSEPEVREFKSSVWVPLQALWCAFVSLKIVLVLGGSTPRFENLYGLRLGSCASFPWFVCLRSRVGFLPKHSEVYGFVLELCSGESSLRSVSLRAGAGFWRKHFEVSEFKSWVLVLAVALRGQ
jgi:hypothetical protein